MVENPKERNDKIKEGNKKTKLERALGSRSTRRETIKEAAVGKQGRGTMVCLAAVGWPLSFFLQSR